MVRVGDRQVKAKEPAYVALHRLMFGLNDRVLWLRLAVNGTIAATGTGDARRVTPKQLEKDLGYDWREIEQVVAAGPGWQRELEGAVPEEFRSWITERVVAHGREGDTRAAFRCSTAGTSRRGAGDWPGRAPTSPCCGTPRTRHEHGCRPMRGGDG